MGSGDVCGENGFDYIELLAPDDTPWPQSLWKDGFIYDYYYFSYTIRLCAHGYMVSVPRISSLERCHELGFIILPILKREDHDHEDRRLVVRSSSVQLNGFHLNFLPTYYWNLKTSKSLTSLNDHCLQISLRNPIEFAQRLEDVRESN